MEESSKIAPHQLDAFLELGVALLQVFDVLGRRHGLILHTKSENGKSKLASGADGMEPYEISTHVTAPINLDFEPCPNQMRRN